MLRFILERADQPQGNKKRPPRFPFLRLGIWESRIATQLWTTNSPFWMQWGNHWGTLRENNFFSSLCPLLPWWDTASCFKLALAKILVLQESGMGQQRWLHNSALQGSAPGQILGRIWLGSSQTSSTARNRKSCGCPEQSMPDCKKDKNKAAKAPLHPSFS